MNDEFRPPIPSSEDDPALDRSLGALARFRPLPGFADRILAHVWVPLPRWARALRLKVHGLVSGPRGWITLGAFSVATAASWLLVIGVTIDSWDRIAWGSRYALRPLEQNWTEVSAAALTYLDGARNGVSQAVAALPAPAAALIGGYAILTLVCLVALRRLVTAPAVTRVSR